MTAEQARRRPVEPDWRKRLGVEPSPPAKRGRRPILKTGRATGPHSLP